MSSSTINLRPRAVDSGATDIECTECTWAHPGNHHLGHGNADYVNQTVPIIGAHIDATGHTVRITVTTWCADGRVDQSGVLMRPRAKPDTP